MFGSPIQSSPRYQEPLTDPIDDKKAVDISGGTIAGLTRLAIPEKSPVNAIAAAGTLTHDGVGPPAPLSAASGTLTSDETLVADGATVTIGETVYTFRAALTTEPATVPYEVLRGANYSEQMANLVLAINGGAGEGTSYSSGTVAHPDVTAGEVFAGAFSVTAALPGAAGNLIAKAEDSDHLDWDGATGFLTGGHDAETVTIGSKTYTFVAALTPVEGEVLIGGSAEQALINLASAINHTGTPGVDYSCAAEHPSVAVAGLTSTTLRVSAKVLGVGGNLLSSTQLTDHFSWGGLTLSGGIDGTVGAANEICADSNFLYHCTAVNTATDANWESVPLDGLTAPQFLGPLKTFAPPAVTVFEGTVSAAGTTVTFSSADDYAQAQKGSMITADGDTRYILSFPGALQATVDQATTWAGGTAITSIRGPIERKMDESGNMLHLVAADGVEMWLSAAGVIEMKKGFEGVLSIKAKSSAPANPEPGDQAMADRQNWDPLQIGSGGAYLTMYLGDVSGWGMITSQLD